MVYALLKRYEAFEYLLINRLELSVQKMTMLTVATVSTAKQTRLTILELVKKQNRLVILAIQWWMHTMLVE